MEIIPAIDLYDGECVRLTQGQFSQITTYPVDPVAVATAYAKQGARRLHVVDLNGAKNGQLMQLNVILNIIKNTSLHVQVGGGIRTSDRVNALLQGGVSRVVLGSLAVNNPTETQRLIKQYGVEKIVLAFDVHIDTVPYVSIQGWQETTTQTLWDCLNQYQALAGLSILCTDIAKDGVLTGANGHLYAECVKAYPQFQWIASGGVSTLSELSHLQETGVAAVVIGKAFYEQRFTLEEAVAEVSTC